MEKIAYDDLVNLLVAAVPELPADPEYVKDGLVYLVFNDLTRFVDSLLESDGNEALLRKIFDFIEAAARTNDRRIIDVLKDAFNELAIKERDKTRSYMGRSTRRIYDEVWDEIYARPSVARKIGRSIRSMLERS
jgi:hypothetical protein